MLHTCRNIDAAARFHFYSIFSPFLVIAPPGNTDKNLSTAFVCVMNMPVIPAAGFKGYIENTHLRSGNRCQIYRREQEIVNLFLESQSQLDAELETKYAAYIDDLAKESEQFYLLIDNAFAPDFKEAFLHSFLLAKAAGVQETDILSSSEDIDAFFLD